MTAEQPLTRVLDAIDEAVRVKTALRALAPQVVRAAGLVSGVFRAGGRLFACGNGGSACDAMHLTEELVARFRRDRPGLAAHHLLDAPTLTCWANDHDFASAFRRQVEALARTGDVLVAISTSGASPNVLQAAEEARSRGVAVLGLTGGGGGALAGLCDECLVVPSSETARVQEAHVTLIHLLCELVEDDLFPGPGAPDAS
jgi:D-sedoheptulose 7-phosphate isomerase